MVKVFQIHRASGGFGQYECGIECQTYDFESVRDYANWVKSENPDVNGWVSSDAIGKDSSRRVRLVEAIRSAQGNVQRGHGVIVAFDVSGTIQLESVDVVDSQ